ncbi:GNAT family N-acetyltransferase [Sphingopyxis sp. RIFCSPHIGHO2_12_FULL_65_19]|uniref:GNAT family N-acetyltransferase n=1 Tax=Sphingopyxis sp. RIFCSPHIGHO2_12_FULL_65_19 TaxID=1802172 RepID=UPI0008CC56D8|nr:GNAT family N-acetyltransferase [Sphingopyxis sp. RIFCSPHIGHO2_12_FULL_65_19]OHD04902.1 MAG: GNAT family N-acetyltransferase [Sphingopyxis sp. RIFCSPHIGHO2_12_FULL_65_19]
MPVPTLTTDRLVLRQIREDDAAALFPVLSDPKAMTWWSSGPHASLAETADYVKGNAAEGQGFHCWAITTGDDVALGWVILIDGKPDVKEVGYILHRDYWGRGLAREAVSKVIDHGFRDLKLRRIFADTDPENAGSIGLLEGLGFQREGHLRGEWETHIGIRDALIYGMLRDEWMMEKAQ